MISTAGGPTTSTSLLRLLVASLLLVAAPPRSCSASSSQMQLDSDAPHFPHYFPSPPPFPRLSGETLAQQQGGKEAEADAAIAGEVVETAAAGHHGDVDQQAEADARDEDEEETGDNLVLLLPPAADHDHDHHEAGKQHRQQQSHRRRLVISAKSGSLARRWKRNATTHSETASLVMKTIVPEVVRPSPSAKGEDEEHQKGATAANGLGLLGAGGGGGQWRTTVVDVSSHELAQEEGVMTAEQVGEDGAAGLHEQDQVPRRPKRRAKRSSATTTADEEDAVAGSLARRNYSHGTPEQDLRAFKEQLRRRLSSQPLRRNKSHGVATFKRLREAASEKKKLQQQQQEQSRRGPSSSSSLLPMAAGSGGGGSKLAQQENTLRTTTYSYGSVEELLRPPQPPLEATTTTSGGGGFLLREQRQEQDHQGGQGQPVEAAAPLEQVITGIPDLSDPCFRRYANSIIVNAQPYERRSTISLVHCKAQCLHSQDSSSAFSCRSFIYDNLNQVCDLFAHVGDQAPARLLRFQSRDYFEPTAAIACYPPMPPPLPLPSSPFGDHHPVPPALPGLAGGGGGGGGNDLAVLSPVPRHQQQQQHDDFLGGLVGGGGSSLQSSSNKRVPESSSPLNFFPATPTPFSSSSPPPLSTVITTTTFPSSFSASASSLPISKRAQGEGKEGGAPGGQLQAGQGQPAGAGGGGCGPGKVARFLRTADFELHKGGGAGAAADDLAARLNPPIVPLDKCLAMCAASAGTIIGKNGTRCNSFEFTPHGGSEETTTTTGEDDAGGGECVLTAETAVPLGNGQLKQRPGTDYYEKICVSQPPPKESNNNNGNKPADGEAGGECQAYNRAPQMILVGFAETVLDAPTLQQCFDNCLDSQRLYGFRCNSGMFYFEEPSLNCILNTEDRYSQADLFTAETSDLVDYFEVTRCHHHRRQPTTAGAGSPRRHHAAKSGGKTVATALLHGAFITEPRRHGGGASSTTAAAGGGSGGGMHRARKDFVEPVPPRLPSPAPTTASSTPSVAAVAGGWTDWSICAARSNHNNNNRGDQRAADDGMLPNTGTQWRWKVCGVGGATRLCAKEERQCPLHPLPLPAGGAAGGGGGGWADTVVAGAKTRSAASAPAGMMKATRGEGWASQPLFGGSSHSSSFSSLVRRRSDGTSSSPSSTSSLAGTGAAADFA